MKSFDSKGLATLVALALVGCGGGDAGTEDAAMAEGAEETGMAETPRAAAELTMPDWITVDEDAQTVTIDLVAGQTDANNKWNYNGHANGDVTVVVPQGYEVTMNFSNQDQLQPHSVAVMSGMGTWPAQFTDPQPVFEGAMSSNPTDMQGATMAGESETITFTASEAGDYALVCLVPAHALTGMWIGFRVSADGSAGLET